jgi:DNA-binding transcriptional ArsR family regulator
MSAFKDLDPLLHAPLRLAVISLLVTSREAEFTWLKKETGATAGNLSIQLQKLRDAGYITIEKGYRDNYPLTLCRITVEGEQAFTAYVSNLQAYIHP